MHFAPLVTTVARTRRRMQGVLAIAALLVVTGLPPASAIMAGAAPDTPADRVDADTADSQWSGVGSVVVDGSPYGGVAIAPRWVLTAAHVVGRKGPESVLFVVHAGPEAGTGAARGIGAGHGAGQVAGQPAGQAAGQATGHAGAPGYTITVDRIFVFPGAHFPYDDYALLRLSEPLPARVRWYQIADVPVPAGTVIRLVGYGASGQGDAGPSVGASAGIRRKGENVIDAITARVDTSGRSGRFFLYDFDGPHGNGPLGGPTLGNARETTVAGGDSGSGAFAQIGARWALVGISTFATRLGDGQPQAARFGSIGGGVLLSDPKFVHWVEEMTDGAAAWVSAQVR